MKKDKTMNIANIFKKTSLGLATVLAGLLISGTAHAIPYTGDTTVASPVPAFNVFTGNMPAPAPKIDGVSPRSWFMASAANPTIARYHTDSP